MGNSLTRLPVEKLTLTYINLLDWTETAGWPVAERTEDRTGPYCQRAERRGWPECEDWEADSRGDSPWEG